MNKNAEKNLKEYKTKSFVIENISVMIPVFYWLHNSPLFEAVKWALINETECFYFDFIIISARNDVFQNKYDVGQIQILH